MEKINLSTRAKARIVLYLTTLIVVLGIFSIVQTVRANRYEKESMILRQMALIALDENLNNISTNLEKTIYVSTPTMLSKLSAELWREASGAKNNLSILPTGENTVSNTYKFLSQIGEFVMSLERKSVSDEQLTDKEREQLKQLNSLCKNLNDKVNQMCHDMQNGNFTFDDSSSTLLNANTDMQSIGKGFDDTEQTMTDVPTLIYDGPFSDSEYNREIKGLPKEEATVSGNSSGTISSLGLYAAASETILAGRFSPSISVALISPVDTSAKAIPHPKSSQTDAQI